jgi:hypothetical protein
MDHFSPLKFIHFYSFALLCVYRAKRRLIPENEEILRIADDAEDFCRQSANQKSPRGRHF